MLVPMTLSNLERRDTKSQIFAVELCSNVSARTNKFRRVTRPGGAYF